MPKSEERSIDEYFQKSINHGSLIDHGIKRIHREDPRVPDY